MEPLDNASIRSCALVCTRWRAISQRLAYRAPRLSSVEALDAFYRSISCQPDLAHAVRSLHIRGKANYSSTEATPWILEVPHRLPYLLPNVRAIIFDQIEGVHFIERFWAGLGAFTKVTSLTVVSCRFFHDSNVRNLIFAFPKLTSLTLSNVRWSGLELLSCPRWNHVLPLKILRLNNLPGLAEYDRLFKWLGGLPTVREMELLGYSNETRDVFARYLHHLADKGGSLESISFAPAMAAYHRHFGERFQISDRGRLSDMHLPFFQQEPFPSSAQHFADMLVCANSAWASPTWQVVQWRGSLGCSKTSTPFPLLILRWTLPWTWRTLPSCSLSGARRTRGYRHNGGRHCRRLLSPTSRSASSFRTRRLYMFSHRGCPTCKNTSCSM